MLAEYQEYTIMLFRLCKAGIVSLLQCQNLPQSVLLEANCEHTPCKLFQLEGFVQGQQRGTGAEHLTPILFMAEKYPHNTTKHSA